MQQTPKHFIVRSFHQMYQVWLGLEHQLPTVVMYPQTAGPIPRQISPAWKSRYNAWTPRTNGMIKKTIPL